MHIGFLDFGIVDILDISFVSILLYQLYRMLQGSVAIRIFAGLVMIYFFSLLIQALGMQLLGGVLGQFMGIGMLAAIILFQQEIRKMLLYIGSTTNYDWKKILKLFNADGDADLVQVNLNGVLNAAEDMSSTNTGALIVFKKNDMLRSFAETGDEIDAVLSERLLISIFHKNSPLHDGAVVVANGKIKAARCIIPVSDNQDLPAQYGLRHRAAMGITEVTDAVVLVVSEETGRISLAYKQRLISGLAGAELKSKLTELLSD